MTNWVGKITSQIKSADRYGDRDVVPASSALDLAARLEECQKARLMLIRSMKPETVEAENV